MVFARHVVAVPVVAVDPALLDQFLPFRLLFSTFLPFFTFEAPAFHRHVPRLSADALPPWTDELERWYQLFHPDTWRILHADHVCDVEHLRLVNDELDAHWAEADRSVEGRAWLDQSYACQGVLEERIFTRWARLLALHEVRSIFISRGRAQHPGIETEQFFRIKLIVAPNAFKPLPALPSQVWPLPLPPPAPQKHRDTGELINLIILYPTGTLKSLFSLLALNDFALPGYRSDDADDAWAAICADGEPIYLTLDADAECPSGLQIDYSTLVDA
ncbi:hypothetical protein JCM10213_006011 [Rhodosporidiobolus nylandii]